MDKKIPPPVPPSANKGTGSVPPPPPGGRPAPSGGAPTPPKNMPTPPAPGNRNTKKSSKALKIAVGVLLLLLLAGGSWLLFFKSDPLSQGIRIAKAACACEKKHIKQAVKVKNKFVKDFASYRSADKEFARRAIEERMLPVHNKYEKCKSKVEERGRKIENSYTTLHEEEKRELFISGFWQQRVLCNADSQPVYEAIERVSRIAGEYDNGYFAVETAQEAVVEEWEEAIEVAEDAIETWEDQVWEVVEEEIPYGNTAKDSEIFTIVEQMPEFPGGTEALYKFIGNNMKYPAIARENSIEGLCVVQFVVNENGSITDVKVLKDIGGGCGEEAARIVRNMPFWKPGKQSGKPVRVQHNLPIRFKIEQASTNCSHQVSASGIEDCLFKMTTTSIDDCQKENLVKSYAGFFTAHAQVVEVDNNGTPLHTYPNIEAYKGHIWGKNITIKVDHRNSILEGNKYRKLSVREP